MSCLIGANHNLLDDLQSFPPLFDHFDVEVQGCAVPTRAAAAAAPRVQPGVARARSFEACMPAAAPWPRGTQFGAVRAFLLPCPARSSVAPCLASRVHSRALRALAPHGWHGFGQLRADEPSIAAPSPPACPRQREDVVPHGQPPSVLQCRFSDAVFEC